MTKCELILGDCRDVLKTLPDCSVQCVVTSPPYWGLRDYGVEGQIGLESDVDLFISEIVAVFREVRRVLKDDGTLWLNLGDSYAGSPGGGQGATGQRATRTFTAKTDHKKGGGDLKRKDLVGIPWMVAFALRADGWYLRQDIIWSKPNPMPESTKDRCTKAHEYMFLLSKSPVYYYDFEAMQEPATSAAAYKMPDGWDTGEGAHGSFHRNGREKGQNNGVGWGHGTDAGERGRERVRGRSAGNVNPPKGQAAYELGDECHRTKAGLLDYAGVAAETRNRRSVWTIPSAPYKEAHFATYPPALVTPCILAGTRAEDTVLDPFNGSGTTGEVALNLGRSYIGIELNPEYLALTESRLSRVTYGLPL